MSPGTSTDVPFFTALVLEADETVKVAPAFASVSFAVSVEPGIVIAFTPSIAVVIVSSTATGAKFTSSSLTLTVASARS